LGKICPYSTLLDIVPKYIRKFHYKASQPVISGKNNKNHDLRGGRSSLLGGNLKKSIKRYFKWIELTLSG
jgi:hypothetical protein